METQLDASDDFGWSVDWAFAMREAGDYELAEEMLDVAFIDAFEVGFSQGEQVGENRVMDDNAEEEHFQKLHHSRCCE